MRVLVVGAGPAYSVADVERGWVKALRKLGLDVAVHPTGDILDAYTRAHVEHEGEWVQSWRTADAVRLADRQVLVSAMEWWPDIVLIISGFFSTPRTLDVLKKRNMTVVAILTESPYEDDTQAGLCEWLDLAIVNDPTNIDQLRQICKTEYIPHAYDPEIHRPGPARGWYECDFGFVGTGYPSRREFFEAVDWSGIHAKIGGNWRGLDEDSPLHPYLINAPMVCLENEDTADLYRSAKVGANLYRKEPHENCSAEGWSMGPREVEMAASRLFFLREARGESDEILPMLPTFTHSDEFGDMIRYYLAHETERLDAAVRAQAAIADRTFDRHAVQMMRLLA